MIVIPPQCFVHFSYNYVKGCLLRQCQIEEKTTMKEYVEGIYELHNFSKILCYFCPGIHIEHFEKRRKVLITFIFFFAKNAFKSFLPISSLTLYHTIMPFIDPENNGFWKQYGNWRK